MRGRGKGAAAAVAAVAAVLVLVSLAAPDARATAPAPSQAAPSIPPAPAVPPMRIELNPFLELNAFLQVQAGFTGPARPEYAPFVQVYAQYRGAPLTTWHPVHDVLVEAKDAAGISAAAKALPAGVKGEDRAGAAAILEAIAGAWPEYEKVERGPHQASLDNAKRELERRFTRRAEPVLVPELMQLMLFKPLDQPITIYPVNRSNRPGDSGHTAKGYYIMQPVAGVPLVESLLHEMTHLLDDNQPPQQATLLRRLVTESHGVDSEVVDAFVHGLVMFNAHELIARRLGPEGAPQFPTSMNPWLKVYDERWGLYLDHDATADDTIKGLVQDLARTSGKSSGAATSSR